MHTEERAHYYTADNIRDEGIDVSELPFRLGLENPETVALIAGNPDTHPFVLSRIAHAWSGDHEIKKVIANPRTPDEALHLLANTRREPEIVKRASSEIARRDHKIGSAQTESSPHSGQPQN